MISRRRPRYSRDLITRKPKTNVDRRVVELSQLALGRVYYEREQPSKSIDTYLLVDRRSDLFPTALYEVVVGLREEQAVRQGAHRARAARSSRPDVDEDADREDPRGQPAHSQGAAAPPGADHRHARAKKKSRSPQKEYEKAEKLFTDTHDAVSPRRSWRSTRMVEGTLDPASFIDQIAGRNTRVFASSAPIPEAAAQWLREEPEVHRVVTSRPISRDPARPRRSEATIARLEGVLATGDRLTLYPALSSRRLRLAAIQHDLIGIRIKLADTIKRRLGGDRERKALQAQYAALGDPERAHGERTAMTQEQYEKDRRECARGRHDDHVVASDRRRAAQVHAQR